VLQAPLFDGVSFDSLPFEQDGSAASEVDVGGREVTQALVIAVVIVAPDVGLGVARQEVILQ